MNGHGIHQDDNSMADYGNNKGCSRKPQEKPGPVGEGITLEGLLRGFRPWDRPHYRSAVVKAAENTIATIRSLQEEIRFLTVDREKFREVAQNWIDHAEKAEAERDKFRTDLQNLKGILAVIHRDGGQYTEKVGIEQSVEEGHKVWADLQLKADTVDEISAKVRVLVEKIRAAISTEPYSITIDGVSAPLQGWEGQALKNVEIVLSNLPEAARKEMERVRGLENTLYHTEAYANGIEEERKILKAELEVTKTEYHRVQDDVDELGRKVVPLEAENNRLQGIHEKVWDALEADVSSMVESQVKDIMEAAQVDGMALNPRNEITRLREALERIMEMSATHRPNDPVLWAIYDETYKVIPEAALNSKRTCTVPGKYTCAEKLPYAESAWCAGCKTALHPKEET